MPELAQALAARVGAVGDIQVVVNRKTAVTFNSGSQKASPRSLLAPTPSLGRSASMADGGDATAMSMAGESINNTPVVPESSGTWKVVVLLLALVIAGAAYYFVQH